MKKLTTEGNGFVELGPDELKKISGGGDIARYFKCVAATMTTGGGGIKTFVLGMTIFGMSRLTGVMVGCSSL
jgi:hypothetical protein